MSKFCLELQDIFTDFAFSWAKNGYNVNMVVYEDLLSSKKVMGDIKEIARKYNLTESEMNEGLKIALSAVRVWLKKDFYKEGNNE